MGNLLQMSITSGQDTDSRQFTLAANSHRLAGETYDANGNRTSGSADGFTSVSYNILNLPETVTAGGWTINYLYSAAGVKLRERVILSDPPVILSASKVSTPCTSTSPCDRGRDGIARYGLCHPAGVTFESW
jgi:hypothetical protein